MCFENAELYLCKLKVLQAEEIPKLKLFLAWAVYTPFF